MKNRPFLYLDEKRAGMALLASIQIFSHIYLMKHILSGQKDLLEFNQIIPKAPETKTLLNRT
jgi:hypothetical protein